MRDTSSCAQTISAPVLREVGAMLRSETRKRLACTSLQLDSRFRGDVIGKQDCPIIGETHEPTVERRIPERGKQEAIMHIETLRVVLTF